MKKEFSDDHIATLGLDFGMKEHTTKIDSNTIEVKVWDTAG